MGMGGEEMRSGNVPLEVSETAGTNDKHNRFIVVDDI